MYSLSGLNAELLTERQVNARLRTRLAACERRSDKKAGDGPVNAKETVQSTQTQMLQKLLAQHFVQTEVIQIKTMMDLFA